MPVGFNNLAFNHGLLLDLPFLEGAGTLTHDYAKPHHELTLNGTPVWTSLANGLMVLDFDDTNPDWLDCPGADTGDLDFTSEPFSMAVWMNADDLSGNPFLFCRGNAAGGDGWYMVFETGVLPYLTFYTVTGPGTGTGSGTAEGIISAGAWYLVGISRSGAQVQFFVNGIDVTIHGPIHSNPAASVRDLNIGIYGAGGTAPFDGKLWRPRIWDRALSAEDWMNLFQLERHWFE